jgi:hypothetical protein
VPASLIGVPGWNSDSFSQRALIFDKPDGYNPYAAGKKRYGLGGTGSANSGPVSSASAAAGYNKRDAMVKAKKQAYLERMQAAGVGNYGGAAYQRGMR